MVSKSRLFFNLLLVIALVGAYVLHFVKPEKKIAYVDSGKLLNGYNNMVDARNAFGEKAKGWQSNIDTLTMDLQGKVEKYEKGNKGMSSQERSALKDEIRGKQIQLSNYQKAIQDMAQKEEFRLNQQVVSQVNVFLERFGKENEYDIILVANQTGNIAYAKEGMDITAEVLKQLNKEYQTIKK